MDVWKDVTMIDGCAPLSTRPGCVMSRGFGKTESRTYGQTAKSVPV